MNIPDNYEQWLAHERHLENECSKYPTCDHCNNPIYEFLFRIDGEALCETCAKSTYGENVNID